jgi:hypothetical protein
LVKRYFLGSGADLLAIPDAKAPAGAFTSNPGADVIGVMFNRSAGVGITPVRGASRTFNKLPAISLAISGMAGANSVRWGAP